MAERAPGTAARFDRAATEEAIRAVRRERPELVHDVGSARREVLRRMLGAAGDDPALADEALLVVFEARQQVDLYPDVAPALDRLAARWPLLAVTNGNADLERTGVAGWFAGAVTATDLGVGKPDPRIFHLACEHLDVAPADVLHVGDDLELDVRGALGAGLRAAWVHRDMTGDAPEAALRFPDLLALVAALEAEDPLP
jgi:putative hydrolase of the HAD superfamily